MNAGPPDHERTDAMSTTMVPRSDISPARPGDHVRDETGEYVVDRVDDHLRDLDDYVLAAHAEDGTPVVLWASEVVTCARHRAPTPPADPGHRLRAAGYRTRVSDQRPHVLIGRLDHGELRVLVVLGTRPRDMRGVIVRRRAASAGSRCLKVYGHLPSGERFSVEDCVNRAVALAREIKAGAR